MCSIFSRTLRTLLMSVAFFYLSAASVWAIVVDDFANTGTSSPWPVTINSTNPSSFGGETSTIGVVGGTRGYMINDTSGNGSDMYLLGNSVLDYQSTSDGSASIRLKYGGAAPFAPSPDLALPFNAGTLTVSFQSLSIPAGETFSLLGTISYDTAPNAHTLHGVGAMTNITGPTSQLVFTYPLDLSASSSQIDAFELDITPPVGAAFQLDSITFTPVPEPYTLAPPRPRFPWLAHKKAAHY